MNGPTRARSCDESKTAISSGFNGPQVSVEQTQSAIDHYKQQVTFAKSIEFSHSGYTDFSQNLFEQSHHSANQHEQLTTLDEDTSKRNWTGDIHIPGGSIEQAQYFGHCQGQGTLLIPLVPIEQPQAFNVPISSSNDETANLDKELGSEEFDILEADMNWSPTLSELESTLAHSAIPLQQNVIPDYVRYCKKFATKNSSACRRPGPTPGSKKGTLNKDGTIRQKPGPKKGTGLVAKTISFPGNFDIKVLFAKNKPVEVKLPGHGIAPLRFKKDGWLKGTTGPKRKDKNLRPQKPNLQVYQVLDLIKAHNGWSGELQELLQPFCV